MKVLNIFRSMPEERYQELADAVAGGHELQVVRLYESDPIDYDALLKAIFECDAVYSWW